MTFVFRRRWASAGSRGKDARLEQAEESKLVGSPGKAMLHSVYTSNTGTVSALAVLIALFILLALLGLMAVSSI
jgi:hypothetical protein